MLCLLVIGADPASLSESDAVTRAMSHLAMSTLERQAGAAHLADASGQSVLGPTSLGWQREALFGGGSHAEDSVILSQRLEVSGRAALRTEAFEADAEALRLGAVAQQARMEASVRTVFHHARFATMRVAVLKDWHDAVRATHGRVEKRVAVGQEAAWAEEHSHHEVVRAELRLALSESTRASAHAHLAGLVGWSVSQAMPSLEGDALPPSRYGSLDAWIARLDEHPAALALQSRRRAGELRIDAGQRGWVPELDVSVGYKRIDTPAETQDGYVAGVNLSLPLGGEAQAEAARGRAERDLAHGELHLWLESQRALVRKAYVHFGRILKVVTRANEHLSHGHEALLSAAETAYDGGELDLYGLLEAHADARDDRLSAVDLAEKAWLAEIALVRLTGGLR